MDCNHNIHYHRLVLRAIPTNCLQALDVGCGRGALARKLARHCARVTAIDVDDECLAFAKAAQDARSNIAFLQGDVLQDLFPESSFDLVVAVATLHHLPMRAALDQFQKLLRPGGVLVIVGLYRAATPVDYTISAVALPISWAIRALFGSTEVGAPLQEPATTLREIRSEFNLSMPGGIFRRRLFFRYSFLWKKPAD